MEIPEKPGGAPWLCALSPLQSDLRWFRFQNSTTLVVSMTLLDRMLGNLGKPPMLGNFGTLKLYEIVMSLIFFNVIDMLGYFGWEDDHVWETLDMSLIFGKIWMIAVD